MYDQQSYLNLCNLKRALILKMILGDIEHNLLIEATFKRHRTNFLPVENSFVKLSVLFTHECLI